MGVVGVAAHQLSQHDRPCQSWSLGAAVQTVVSVSVLAVPGGSGLSSVSMGVNKIEFDERTAYSCATIIGNRSYLDNILHYSSMIMIEEDQIHK